MTLRRFLLGALAWVATSACGSGDGTGGAAGAGRIVTTAATRPVTRIVDGSTSTWVDSTPRPAPSAWPAELKGRAGAYDDRTGLTYIYGGYDPYAPVGQRGPTRDLWAWDASAGTFTNLTPAAPTDAWPPAMGDEGMAYDRRRGVVVLAPLGGPSVWEWDGAHWAERRFGQEGVSNFLSARMTYAPDLGRTLLVHEGRLTRDPIEVSAWDGETPRWIPIATLLPIDGRPIQAAAYDERRKTLVIGTGNAPTNTAELWEFDLTTGTLTNCTPSPAPDGWVYNSWDDFVYEPLKGVFFTVFDRRAAHEWDPVQNEFIVRRDASGGEPDSEEFDPLVFDSRRNEMVLVATAQYGLRVYEWDAKQ